MSYKVSLIIVILATGAFLLYIWQFGFPPFEEEGPQVEIVFKEADAQAPAAGICDFNEEAAVIFEIQEGIPSPRCARVLPGQIIVFQNNSNELLDFNFAGMPFTIEPGENATNGRRVETYLKPGVHVVTMEFYGGSGPEIWMADNRTFKLAGTVIQQFTSARAITVETASGEVSLGITDDTKIFLESGEAVSSNEFSLYLTAGTAINAIAHIPEANTGTALQIQITSEKDVGPVACTLEAKLCPDGSTVGRVGPNCEFAPCPGE